MTRSRASYAFKCVVRMCTGVYVCIARGWCARTRCHSDCSCAPLGVGKDLNTARAEPNQTEKLLNSSLTRSKGDGTPNLVEQVVDSVPRLVHDATQRVTFIDQFW